MSKHYILDENHKPVDVPLMEWARWFETANRTIEKTKISKEVKVSTVFLGLDHNFSGTGVPILFETMVFGGKFDQEMERYTTWEQAEEGHKKWVKKVQK